MRSFLILLLSLWLSTSALAATVPDASQLKQALDEAKAAKSSPAQAEQVQSLEAALNYLSERDASLERAKQYQQVIDDFPRLARELRQQITSLDDGSKSVRGTMSKGESAEFCDECGEPIPQARREAVPGVRFCLACQQEHDKALKGSALFNRRGSKDSQLR